jgi:hypothetical protein
VDDNISPILTSLPGTKFTAQQLIAGISTFSLSNEIIAKYMFPFVVEYNKTFEPSISDPAERCTALKAAARKGNLYARFLYACCFANSRGRRRNLTKALKHYQLAGNRGSPEGQVLAFSLLTQTATDNSDWKLALRYLLLAVEQGDATGPFPEVVSTLLRTILKLL